MDPGPEHVDNAIHGVMTVQIERRGAPLRAKALAFQLDDTAGLPLPGGGVKFTRDFREGLASGRPVDPRLSVLRIDALDGSRLAGWVCFAAHPSVVIFDAPVSAEYPGYLTDRLKRTLTGGAPVLFGVGACGDVNCVPMFGSEEDSRRLGETSQRSSSRPGGASIRLCLRGSASGRAASTCRSIVHRLRPPWTVRSTKSTRS